MKPDAKVKSKKPSALKTGKLTWERFTYNAHIIYNDSSVLYNGMAYYDEKRPKSKIKQVRP